MTDTVESRPEALHTHSHGQNRFAVLPTPDRLKVDASITGAGITIALLDSGFYPHPDLTQPSNRILAFHDSTGTTPAILSLDDPRSWAWHGTQTSVVAAGNGTLSDGVYKGLAPKANLVLVRASGGSRDTETSILRGIEWVLQNRERYGIRVVSISIGTGPNPNYRDSPVDLAATELVRNGVVVCAAVGNQGCGPDPNPGPPATSPDVISVGGYNDRNELGNNSPDLYCSSYGTTERGIVKPEIIAPAIWVAAPILPGTDFERKADALSRMASAPDYLLKSLVREFGAIAEIPSEAADRPVSEIRSMVDERLQRNKIIATHYQHVDGTSFASPITAAVVAQMLEVNPALTPGAVKHILLSTAQRLRGAQAIRQGFGMLNPAAALAAARREVHPFNEEAFSPPRLEGAKLRFRFHSHEASRVTLAGDFNGWDARGTRFLEDLHGEWNAEIEAPAPGRYRYKFVIDDPSNGVKEPDGFGGFNSVVEVSAAEMQAQP